MKPGGCWGGNRRNRGGCCHLGGRMLPFGRAAAARSPGSIRLGRADAARRPRRMLPGGRAASASVGRMLPGSRAAAAAPLSGAAPRLCGRFLLLGLACQSQGHLPLGFLPATPNMELRAATCPN